VLFRSLTWTYTGANGNGYNALQITEVTGQLHDADPGEDLYFATQDNHIWASADSGATWTARRCCEGFFLNIWRDSLEADQTKLSGVSCASCGNFISGAVLAGHGDFPNPPDTAGNPRLLKPGNYIQNTKRTDSEDNYFSLTTDNGDSWADVYSFTEPVRALSQVAGSADDPVIFTAIKNAGTTPDGFELIGIKRIAGALGSGAPVLSDVTGFGALGIFPTMFAWYKPYGVDPDDANFLVVPDIIDETIKFTTDGGANWTADDALRILIANGDEFQFRWGKFVQVTTFGFDPECEGHILIGTKQAGILQSFDHGQSWRRVPESRLIPNVSSFFFADSGEVIISSYGRGLWRLRYRCPDNPLLANRFVSLQEPVLYFRGTIIPLPDLTDPESCPRCTYFLVKGGHVTGVRVDNNTGVATNVSIDRGQVHGREQPEFFRQVLLLRHTLKEAE